MIHNPVGWFEIYVRDIDRAREFYEGVFSVSLRKLKHPDSEMWAFPRNLHSAGACGALVHMPVFLSGTNNVLLYFSCEDCAVEAARVATFGGQLRRPKQAIGEYGYVAMALDTESNLLGLHSLK